MQRTLNSMGNGQFGFIDARNMDLDSMDITKMMNDMQSMQPKAEVKKKKKDNPGCWEMTVTMEDGMRKKIRGHLCHDEYEAGDIELSRLIRETLARPYPLWLFNGRLEEGAGMSFA